MTGKRVFLIVVVPVLLVAGALTAAGAQDGPRSPEQRPILEPDPVGSSSEPEILAPPPNSAATTTFVPITPCRMVNTRSRGGIFTPNTTRTYRVAGTDFFTQGGATGGCGVPAHATAIAATITAVTPEGDGYVRAWPTGQPAPNATLLNYHRSGGGIGTGTTVAVTPGAGAGLSVRNFGSRAHLVIDLTGYYASPMWATINAAGNIVYSSDSVTSVSRTTTGNYQVNFATPVLGCATTGSAESSYHNLAAYRSASNQVVVLIRDIEFLTYQNSGFSLQVTC